MNDNLPSWTLPRWHQRQGDDVQRPQHDCHVGFRGVASVPFEEFLSSHQDSVRPVPTHSGGSNNEKKHPEFHCLAGLRPLAPVRGTTPTAGMWAVGVRMPEGPAAAGVRGPLDSGVLVTEVSQSPERSSRRGGVAPVTHHACLKPPSDACVPCIMRYTL